MAIRGTIVFFMAIRSLNTAVCRGQRYTFEQGLPQQNEIQYQPFYINSPPVRGALGTSMFLMCVSTRTYTWRIFWA
jgi:hypothetical protein